MATIDADMVQSGWSVWTSDGEELGTVVRVEPSAILVKTGGLLGREVSIPKESVDEVETGRVDLAVAKSEIDK